MRLVSTFSLQQGWRGQPQILQLFVIPGEEAGVRLVVNETPYTGARGAGAILRRHYHRPGYDSGWRSSMPTPGRTESFVLADKLAYCRFSYYTPSASSRAARLAASWARKGWPLAVRIEMAPARARSFASAAHHRLPRPCTSAAIRRRCTPMTIRRVAGLLPAGKLKHVPRRDRASALSRRPSSPQAGRSINDRSGRPASAFGE